MTFQNYNITRIGKIEPLLETIEKSMTIKKFINNTLIKKKKSKYFPNLEGFLSKFSFKQTSLPWAVENDGYRIHQVIDEDSLGFAIYSITPKRYIDESSFRGRLPNSIFAEEILIAIAEDYSMDSLDKPPTTYPRERDDVFLTNLAAQTELRLSHDIHISIEYVITSGGDHEYVYEIIYFPKAKENEKRAFNRQERISSYWDSGSSYGGAFSSYESALAEAVRKVYNCIINKEA